MEQGGLAYVLFLAGDRGLTRQRLTTLRAERDIALHMTNIRLMSFHPLQTRMAAMTHARIFGILLPTLTNVRRHRRCHCRS